MFSLLLRLLVCVRHVRKVSVLVFKHQVVVQCICRLVHMGLKGI
jgi:hypothetical protein